MATDVSPWLLWPSREVKHGMFNFCLICLWFSSSYCRYMLHGCVSASTVKNNIPLTVPEGIYPPFCYSTADLNITTAVVDAENTVGARKQGSRSGASAVVFLIQALAKGSGRQCRF